MSEFAAAKVDYLIVGGYAVSYHASPRYTKDIDLWIDPDVANIERVYQALARFGVPQSVLHDLQNLEPDEFFFFGRPPVRVDILQAIPGLDFRQSFARRVEADWDGVPVKLVSLEDLVRASKPQAALRIS